VPGGGEFPPPPTSLPTTLPTSLHSFQPVLEPSLQYQPSEGSEPPAKAERRPSIVLNTLQGRHEPAQPVDFTPLQVHESLASRAASPLERAEDCGELVARMLHYQQQQQPSLEAGDQGWRLPVHRPLHRQDLHQDQDLHRPPLRQDHHRPLLRQDPAGWPGKAEDSGPPLGGSWGARTTQHPQHLAQHPQHLAQHPQHLAQHPQPLSQHSVPGPDRWLPPPPSAHHQAGGWGGWGDRGALHLQQDLLRLQDRLGRGEDCGSGLSRESSRDDINSECDQQFEYEQRFRVDRRKLELMMMNSPEFGEVAAEFFERIGAETNTCVIWPSRLKIGAKSKKDPHIRVGGAEEGVKRAKTMITEVLDTTTNSRVTMKMDVSYTDHSHIIGKGGNTIRRVMAETNCHIHFPDSNRSNPNEKSNQVSIAGEMAGVERARARVRELTPLLFNFDLPIVPSFQTAPDTNSPFLRAIQDQYNIQIMFRQKQKNFHTTTVVVKGCEWECSRVKEATLLLMDNLCTGLAGSVPVVMLMEISPQHHATVLGKGNINLKIVMQRTNTVIIFPDAGDPNIPPIKKGSVTISGAIHNVYLARQLLLGSLPIVMMFDLPESLEVEEATIARLQEEQDVTVSIKPKARQTNKSCIIKAQERNCAGVYLARHALLQLDRQEEELVRAEIPETYKVPLVGSSSDSCMAAQPPCRGPYLNINTHLANSLAAAPLSPSYFPGTPIYTPSLARPPSPWHLPASLPPPPPPSTPVGGLCGLPPNHPFLQDYAMLVLQNMTRLQQQAADAAEVAAQPGVSPSPCQHTDGSRGQSGHGSSGLGSSLQSSPLRSSPRPAPRNSSPTHSGGNLTAHQHKIDLSKSSGIGDAKNSSISDLSVILSELSASDRRAPGCEKKVAQIAGVAADYESKRLLATKAMHHKPAGETRTPTPAWSGLGFSCSMPEAVIRELEHNKAKAAREKEVASNSDWFGQSVSGLDSMLGGREVEGAADGLTQLLANQGLSKYTDTFVRHEIDLPTFVTLTDEELKEIGIPTFGARKKLLLLGKEAGKKLAQGQ